MIKREIFFPSPIKTRYLKIIFTDANEGPVSLKLDLLGMSSKDQYDLNPYLDPLPIPISKNLLLTLHI